MSDLLKRDIAYLKASPSELETFLLSNDVIRMLPDFTLSTGGILLAYRRLTAANLDEPVQSSWQEIQEIRDHWKIAWATKCQLEMKMRLRQWGDFILGMAPDKHEISTEYRHQVRNRAIFQLLGECIPEKAAEYQDSIERKDKIFEKFSVPNDFVWEAEVQPGFSKDEFWYLYRTMKYEKAQK